MLRYFHIHTHTQYTLLYLWIDLCCGLAALWNQSMSQVQRGAVLVSCDAGDAAPSPADDCQAATDERVSDRGLKPKPD